MMCVYIHRHTILHSVLRRSGGGIFNAWNQAQNTVYNLAQRSPHREQQQQQHDREQQQKDQEWRRSLLSDNNDYDREDIIISIDDDVSAMSSPSTSSSTLVEGTRSNNNDHNQENPKTTMMKQQEEEDEKKKDRKVRVVSFRLSERDYARHLSMAKLCYENGLTKGPDIVSYIRLSMECLSRYIITSQAEAERSAEKGGEQQQQQQQQQIKKEGSMEQQHDLNNYHTMTAPSSSSRAAAAITNTAMGEQHTRESIARTTPLQPPPTPPLFNNLHEYFQPVFDQLDKLNKMLDSHIEEEKIINPKRKRNDDSTVSDAHV
jgi:hypothetical protein